MSSEAAVVLPASARLRRRSEFSVAVRTGRRAAVGSLVAHLGLSGSDAPLRPSGGRGAPSTPSNPPTSRARAGFVVGRSVGNAVVRNGVRRRLRHLTRDRLGRLPAGSVLVVRALAGAGGRTSGELGTDLDRALSRVLR